MATFSKNGRRIGRPPGPAKQKLASAVGAAVENPRIQPGLSSADAQAIAIGKATMHFMARYDAAGRGKRVAAWQPPSSGPNTALSGLQVIRDRSRDSVRNDWTGESLIQKWATTLIGIGITPRFRRIKDKPRKQAVADLWDDFVKTADADGVLNLYGLQTLVIRAWLESGECFLRRRPRFLDEGLPLPMQIQVLESDMLPIFSATVWPGMPEGNVIKDGIEFNKRGRRIAYWFYKEHPGDAELVNIGADALVRVPAYDVAHVIEPKRPGQRRGVPIIAPVIMRLRNTGDYEDTTLERQKIANLWVGFITRSLPEFNQNDVESDPVSGLARVVDDSGNGLLPLRPGLIQELEDGQSFNFANPPEAGTTYSDYIRTQHLGTSAGGGMPYEIFSGDIANISDRTLRVVINEFRRFAEQRQWQIAIPQMCQRTVDWFADAAVLADKVSLDEVDLVRRVEHSPHGWAYIHPVQDPQGKVLEVEAGFRSRSSVIGEKGDDPETVDAERQEDEEREQSLNIGPYSEAKRLETAGPAKSNPSKKGDNDGIDNDEYSAPPNARIQPRGAQP